MKINKTTNEVDGLRYAMIRSIAPYGFNVLSVQDDGTIVSNFPRVEVQITINPLQTVCFLWRREEYEPASWGRDESNLNLVMFVRNYGFQQQISAKLPDERASLDGSMLCHESFVIRGFGKSKLMYELGWGYEINTGIAMKSLLIFVVAGTFFVGCQNSTSTNQHEDLDKQPEFDYSDADCTYRKSTRKPATTFPFSVADKIEVVSFKRGMTEMTDSRFMIQDLREHARLNKIQTDSLFSILFDYGYQKPKSSSTVADCYAPHHAILFYRSNKAVAFLEICLYVATHAQAMM